MVETQSKAFAISLCGFVCFMFIYTILEMLWLIIIWSESSRCLQMKTIFKKYDLIVEKKLITEQIF